MDQKSDIGLVGLAVMGQNLVLNMADHGYQVSVFNRTTHKVDDFINGAAKGHKNVVPAYSIDELVSQLKAPRKVMLMVKAGEVVDSFIQLLLPHLEEGDIIIDGGNSHYPDSIRRTKELGEKGILFIGSGISGGEEGARKGPSIMPGGNREAWPHISSIFKDISAKTEDGTPCCDWVGDDGAGHYVKMVHNGIEYGDMQIITEAYHIMSQGLGLSYDKMHTIFSEWNKTELDSYLIEITRDIMAYRDESGEVLVEKILDRAGQKGTGKWTGISALDMGMPLTLIGEAVFARSLSALKDERITASRVLPGPEASYTGDIDQFVEMIRKALLSSKIVSYAQGYMLLKEAAKEHNWELDYGNIALLWRGGCIIRSVFLDKIKEAYHKKPDLENLLLDEYFSSIMKDSHMAWRTVVAEAVKMGIPTPAFSSALAFYDGYRTENLPANLLQALRDYFGAHTYERKDKPRGEFFHTNWTGTGGNTASTTYNA